MCALIYTGITKALKRLRGYRGQLEPVARALVLGGATLGFRVVVGGSISEGPRLGAGNLLKGGRDVRASRCSGRFNEAVRR